KAYWSGDDVVLRKFGAVRLRDSLKSDSGTVCKTWSKLIKDGPLTLQGWLEVRGAHECDAHCPRVRLLRPSIIVKEYKAPYYLEYDYSGAPSWFRNLYMDRPTRAEVRRLGKLVLRGRDPEVW